MILGGHRYRLYGQTRESVSRQLVAALRAHQEGQLPLGSRETFGRFWNVWLPSIRSNLRPRTWTRYEELGRIHLLPLLGATRIGDLSVQKVQALHGRMLGMGVSPSTVHHAHAVLHRALADAVRWGVVSRNVAGLVPPPRMATHEMQTLSGAQARELCRAAAGSRFEALYVLAVTTGMRQGELLALRWSGVDLDRGLVQVTGTMTRTEAGLGIAPPKTARSRRAVALADQAIEALIRHRGRQKQEKALLGEAWVDEDLVFPNSIGGPMQRDHLVKRDFAPLLQRAGLPAIRFHDLRHTAATLLLGESVHPKVAPEMLGHATVAITLDRYSHVTETMQRAAAQSMSELLRGTSGGPGTFPGSG
ncbi:MAG: tyrosine-type recombinase/integrase [Candidatus Dormibacteria bacterium]